MYIPSLIKTSANCTTPHLHVVDGVGVVVDGSDGSDVETAGPLPMVENTIQYARECEQIYSLRSINSYIRFNI